jgi:hypothetical protein
MNAADAEWFGVRTLIRWTLQACYEERVTIWWAMSADEAAKKALAEASSYAELLGPEYRPMQFAQTYRFSGAPEDGREVFSLLRNSEAEPDEYIDRSFDTGGEHQTTDETGDM